MIVSGKYELLDVLHESGIRTYRARQVALGHLVMVHFIAGTETEDDFALLDQLAELPDSERKLFFDAGEHESVPYLVSWPLPGFHSLPDWLERTLGEHRVEPKAAIRAPETSNRSERVFAVVLQRLERTGCRTQGGHTQGAGTRIRARRIYPALPKAVRGRDTPAIPSKKPTG